MIALLSELAKGAHWPSTSPRFDSTGAHRRNGVEPLNFNGAPILRARARQERWTL